MSIQPRAIGHVALSVKHRSTRTELDTLRQSGSLRCLFPRPKSPALEAVLVNTAGGITGGDKFHVTADVPNGCTLTLTTQAAERAYRAQSGLQGRLNTTLQVAPGGRINWLPQEMILFDGSALQRSLSVTLAQGARALIVEPVVYGRGAMGEQLNNLRLNDHIAIHRDGQAGFLDKTQFTGDMARHLDRPNIAHGARAMALVVYVAPDAPAHLAPIRDMLPAHAGATVIGDDMLILRLLAKDSFCMRKDLIPILNRLSHAALPRCWMI